MEERGFYRLGILWPLPPDMRGETTNKFAFALFNELRQRGFIEGQNLKIDYRAYAPHVDLTSQYAAELVKAEVDVIFAVGDLAIRAASERVCSKYRYIISCGLLLDEHRFAFVGLPLSKPPPSQEAILGLMNSCARLSFGTRLDSARNLRIFPEVSRHVISAQTSI